MSTLKRPGLPRYLRRPLVSRRAAMPPAGQAPSVLIRTVAFVPAYQRKRLH